MLVAYCNENRSGSRFGFGCPVPQFARQDELQNQRYISVESSGGLTSTRHAAPCLPQNEQVYADERALTDI